MTAQLMQVALLDAADVYLGTELLPADRITPAHVRLPDGCDLPPGKYYWARTANSFLPLRTPQQVAETSPVALNALAWMLLAMHGAGLPLPSASMQWLDFYVKTIDFAYTGDSDAEHLLLANYAAARNLK